MANQPPVTEAVAGQRYYGVGGPRKGRPPKDPRKDERSLVLRFGPVVQTAVQAIIGGLAPEIAIFGTRGDGKTIGVCGSMIFHAGRHDQAKFELPTTWMGVADTFASHKLKTVASLEHPLWKGAWKKYDSGRLMVATINGREHVHLHLFGIEDQGAMDRVRMEVHGVWFEEPAPAAVLIQSTGVDETAWSIALTSRRKGMSRDPKTGVDIPGSVCYPAVMTLNYPDEDHWTWTRFKPTAIPLPEVPSEPEARRDWYAKYFHACQGYHPDDRARLWFRVPPGERASSAQRAEWAHALRDRPDVLKRLIAGTPGTIAQGPQVAEGFREDLHVSPDRLRPIQGEPLLFGLDFGHTPTVTIGQPWRGSRRILAALTIERGGVKQLCENEIIPWLELHAPWARTNKHLIVGTFDPAGNTDEQTDIEKDPIGVVEELLGGIWSPGLVDWESRKHVLISMINHHVSPGKCSLQIDPVDGMGLIRALSGRWHYPQDRLGKIRKETPKKPNHPWEDYGDSFIYWGCGLTAQPNRGPQVPKVETQFDVGRIGQPQVQSDFQL